MASRRSDRRGSSFAGKFVTWATIAGLIYWAGREPAQAATLFHYIGGALASLASHHGTHTH